MAAGKRIVLDALQVSVGLLALPPGPGLEGISFDSEADQIEVVLVGTPVRLRALGEAMVRLVDDRETE
jgi:hypothetical protein